MSTPNNSTGEPNEQRAGQQRPARQGSKARYRVLPINLRSASEDSENSITSSLAQSSHTPTKHTTAWARHEPSKETSPSTSIGSEKLSGLSLGQGNSEDDETNLTNEHGLGAAATSTDTTNTTANTASLAATPAASRHRRTPTATEKILELRGVGKHAWMPPVGKLDTHPGQSLIVRRLQKTKERLSAEAQEQRKTGLRELQQSFVSKQPILDSSSWEFWASVVGDYDLVARERPDELRKAIQGGFPDELRGLLWQVIASSKSQALEQLYADFVNVEEVPCSAAIAKDLDRTPMAKRVDRESLARVLRAYSLFDPEVGYTQGMAFIAVPLLVELGEVEAFSLFVQLMKTYDFRSIFLNDMPGLHLKLYQFERLIEDNLESVHTHLRRQGVQSSMYASQWFLTMFAYRFPPSLVTRIFDITIAEGLEALLRFAYSLMEAAAPTILTLEGLDHLLPFLKERIFDQFDGSENELVGLASKVELLPQVVSKFELEFQELNRLEKERLEHLDTLRNSNVRLSLQNKNLEATLETLNGEHVQIVNKMIQKRWDLVHLQDENMELRQELTKSQDAQSSYGEIAKKLEAMSSEIVQLRNEKEALQHELALLQQSQDISSTAELLKEVQQLREMNKRYESQLGSLQESLASALDNH